MADIKQWFMSIPVITRYWFGLSFVIPVLGRIGLFNPYHMFMTKDAIWKLEVKYIFVMLATFVLKKKSFFFLVMETIHWYILLSNWSGYWISLSNKSIFSLSIFKKS